MRERLNSFFWSNTWEMSNREAFAYGVAKTGPVIISAGVIMVVAFGGLMMSIPLWDE